MLGTNYTPEIYYSKKQFIQQQGLCGDIISIIFIIGLTIYTGIILPSFILSISIVSVFTFLFSISTEVSFNPYIMRISVPESLTYRKFAIWAEVMARMSNLDYFSNTDIHYTEKFTVFKNLKLASNHVNTKKGSRLLLRIQIILSIILVIALNAENYLSQLPPEELSYLGIISGLLFGIISGKAIGQYYRWIRGKDILKPPKSTSKSQSSGKNMNNNYQVYTPSMKKFIKAITIYSFPCIFFVIIDLITHRIALWALIVTGILTLYLILSTIFVEMTKIIITNEGILLISLFGKVGGKWGDVHKAQVRERHTFTNKNDKLLILYGQANEKLLVYSMGLLSKKDQKSLLLVIKKRFPTDSIFDKGNIFK